MSERGRGREREREREIGQCSVGLEEIFSRVEAPTGALHKVFVNSSRIN